MEKLPKNLGPSLALTTLMSAGAQGCLNDTSLRHVPEPSAQDTETTEGEEEVEILGNGDENGLSGVMEGACDILFDPAICPIDIQNDQYDVRCAIRTLLLEAGIEVRLRDTLGIELEDFRAGREPATIYVASNDINKPFPYAQVGRRDTVIVLPGDGVETLTEEEDLWSYMDNNLGDTNFICRSGREEWAGLESTWVIMTFHDERDEPGEVTIALNLQRGDSYTDEDEMEMDMYVNGVHYNEGDTEHFAFVGTEDALNDGQAAAQNLVETLLTGTLPSVVESDTFGGENTVRQKTFYWPGQQ